MITLRVWFVVILLAMAVAGCSVWSVLSPSPVAVHRSPSSAAVSGSLDQLQPVAAEPHLDVYGNEIEDAIGDYRIDPRGDIYERHSPETEVPRLAPPVI